MCGIRAKEVRFGYIGHGLNAVVARLVIQPALDVGQVGHSRILFLHIW